MSLESQLGFHVRIPAALRRPALALSVTLLAALAWLALWLTGATHGFIHLTHGTPHASPLVMAGVFIGGWSAMTVAMMLPTALPVLATVNGLARGRNDRTLLLSLVVSGYVGIWTAFGALAYLAALAVQELLLAYTELPVRVGMAPLLLVLAGSFQITSLKYRCLEKCRSPFTFALSYWQGVHQRWHALRLGIGHGVYCVGCCWALMLLMFAAGAAHLTWMLVLALLMAAEKNASWGRRLSAPLGFVLVGAGLALWTVR